MRLQAFGRGVDMAKENERSKITWRSESRIVDDLIPYKENPHQLTEKQVKDLQETLERFDLAEIPTVNTDNTVIAGRQRLKTLQALGRGKDRVSVRVPDRKLTRKEVEEYNIQGKFIDKLWKVWMKCEKT